MAQKKETGQTPEAPGQEQPVKRGRGGTKGKGSRPGAKGLRKFTIPVEENAMCIQQCLDMFSWGLVDKNDPVAVQERVELYFQNCGEHGVIPSVPGIAFALGVDRATLWTWVSGGVKHINPDSVDVLKKAYQTLNILIESYGQTGRINTIMALFLLKNHFGYKDQTEVHFTAQNQLGDGKSAEELRGKYLEDTTVIDADYVAVDD